MTRIKDTENHIYGYLAASVITLFCSAGAILIVALSWLSGTAESTAPYIATSGAITLLVQCYMLGKTAGPVESFFRGSHAPERFDAVFRALPITGKLQLWLPVLFALGLQPSTYTSSDTSLLIAISSFLVFISTIIITATLAFCFRPLLEAH
tara:strand:+ start:1170 stop:1625 length:456 start_codon:yes stop_codon:yes gene_type:complete